MKQRTRNKQKSIIAFVLVAVLLAGLLPGNLKNTLATGKAKTEVSMALDSRSNGSGASGFWFTVSPTDDLKASESWAERYFGNVYIGDEVKSSVPLIKILSNLYYVALSDGGLTATPNAIITIKGDATDGTNTVTFKETSFQFRTDGDTTKWSVVEEKNEVDLTLNYRSDTSTGAGFYFTVSQSDKLTASESWNKKYYGNVYVGGELKENVPLIKILSDLYYVALSDGQSTATANTVVTIKGDATDGTNKVTFKEKSFVYQENGKWAVKEDIQKVKITKDTRSEKSGASGFWFVTSPADSLVFTGWNAYKGSCVYINGVLKTEVPVCKAESNLYYVALSDVNLSATAGTVVTIKGILSDGTNKVEFEEENFTYGKDGKWRSSKDAPEELPRTSVTISNDSKWNHDKQTGIYFYVSPSDSLVSSSGWDKRYTGDCLYIDGQLKNTVQFIKISADRYFINLPDAGITPKEGMKVKVDGVLTDGASEVELLPATFIYKNSKWVLEGTLEAMDLKPAVVKVYDIYELENLSKITIPGGKYYNLTNLKKSSNVGLRFQISDLPGEAVFTLAKAIANNVWVDSGYQIRLRPEGKSIDILEKNNSVAEVTNVDFSEAFVFEYGVADMYPENGGTEAVARRVYVKVNGSEVLNWLDTDMEREMGTYVPAWAQYDAVIESVDYKGYELRNSTPSVQDISELMDDLSTFTVSPGRETKVGSAKNATNTGIRMKVKWDAPVKEDGDELLLSFSNNSDAGIWMGKDGGYNVLITKYGISVRHCDEDSLNASTSCEIPQDEFLLEIGTYDQNVYKNSVKVEDYAKVVYVKIDGKEVLTFADKNVDRNLGTNLWAYSSKKVQANLVSLTSDRYLVKDTPIVNDLFDATKLSKTTLKSGKTTALGSLTNSTNVAFKTKVTLDKNCEELFFGMSKVDKEQYWDLKESGWQFWLKPKNQQIFIVYNGANAGALRAFPITEEFILEIGERNVSYNNGETYCREVYIAIDGEIVLTYADKDYDRPLGTYLHALVSGGYDVTLESLTTTGYVPTEKKISATDIYDASGYAAVSMQSGLLDLGEVTANKNSAIKMKVDVTSETEEFGISLGKTVNTTITEDVTDAGVSGWNIWIKPKWKLIDIQWGYYQKGVTVNYDIPESFILEVGSRDVYYENGKYYGYEVYVKINDETVASWLDDGIKNRTVGTHVLAYANPNANANLTFTTLYPTTTLPVEYVVNGEVQSKVESVSTDSTVVVGKPSKIVLTTALHPSYNLYNEGVTVAGKEVEALELETASKGVYTYEVSANKGDKVVVNLKRTELKTDKPEKTLDVSTITNLPSISVQGLKEAPAGNMVADGEWQRSNSAVQFKVELPKSGGAVRWGMYSDQNTCWGCNGFILSIAPRRAVIYSVGYDVLASMSNDILTAGTTLYVEGGMLKCYEDGNYKYNRFYIKAGTTPDNMEMICWYDSRERGGFGTNVTFIGMDYEESYTIYSTNTICTLTDTSTQENKNKLASYTVFKQETPAVYYPQQVVAYRDANAVSTPASIKLYPKDGMKLTGLTVSGKNVTANVTAMEDGSYVYTLPSVSQNVTFSYTLAAE